MFNPGDPLGAFERLAPHIYFYHPMMDKNETGNRLEKSPETPQPDLIIVCSWMAAAPKHIAKYTDTYLSRYPSIPILLVRCSQHDALIKSEWNQVLDIRPAITAVQSVFGSLSSNSAPRVLVHIFSNGGSWSAGVLSKGYNLASGLTLPVSALVLDSCPSLPDVRLSHRALSAALPKIPVVHFMASMLLWVVLNVLRITNKLQITENIVLKVRKVLNDPDGPFLKGAVPRVYICSRSDAMVPLEDVKLHADEAQSLMKRTGLQDEEAQRRVRFEEFTGTPHVGHIMLHPERYWQTVREVWKEGMRVQSESEHSLRKKGGVKVGATA